MHNQTQAQTQTSTILAKRNMSFVTVLGLPEWPAKTEHEILIVPDLDLSITATTDYRIKIECEGLQLQTARIFAGAGCMFILFISKCESTLNVLINGAPIRTMNDNCYDVYYTTLKPPSEQPIGASVDIETICAESVTRRASLFLPRSGNSAHDEIPKSLEDQVNELKNIVKRLQEFLENIRNGKAEYFASVAVELRALLYFKETRTGLKKSYDPLLFRLAAHRQLPLPIYADTEKNGSIGEAFTNRSEYALSFPTLTKTRIFPGQEMMDILEALESRAFVTKQIDCHGNIIRTEISSLDIIADIANKSGAHYDQVVQKSTRFLRECIVGQRQVQEFMLLSIAYAIIPLSISVLHAYGIEIQPLESPNQPSYFPGYQAEFDHMKYWHVVCTQRRDKPRRHRWSPYVSPEFRFRGTFMTGKVFGLVSSSYPWLA